MHGYRITCLLKHSSHMNLRYKGFQQFAPKTFLAVYSARYVTSQVDMNDSHFHFIDIANSSRFIITSVLFL